MQQITLTIFIGLVTGCAYVNGTTSQECVRFPQLTPALSGRPLQLTLKPALVAARRRLDENMLYPGRHRTRTNAMFRGPLKVNVRPPETFIEEKLDESTSYCTPNILIEHQRHAKFLEAVDKILEKAYDEGSVVKYADAKRLLLEWNAESKPSSETLWRLANACHYLSDLDKSLPRTDKYALIKEGYVYAENAVLRNEQNHLAHKWMAILSGAKGNFEGGIAKVRGGALFDVHINRALKLKPNDPHLHFLKGFLQLQIGRLGRCEKLAASSIFSNFPTGTYKDAIQSFQRAGELFIRPWKINSAYLARSYYQDKNVAEARRWLKIAEDIAVKTKEDEDAEIVIADLRKSLK